MPDHHDLLFDWEFVVILLDLRLMLSEFVLDLVEFLHSTDSGEGKDRE